MKNFNYSLLVFTSLAFVGCQTTTAPIQTTIEKPKATLEEKPAEPESRVKVTPYPDSGIRRESQPLPSSSTQTRNPPAPPRVILPEQTQRQQNLKDGRGVAAYQQLMQDYQQSLNKNDLSAAENYLIQAQRIAPQSADVYRELARLANLKKQGANAEALARKGLTFAQNNTQRKQLWQQILQSAQLRNNAILIQQAQQNIARY